MSKKITYIIPLHIKDDRVFRAISSVSNDAEIFVSAPKDVREWLSSKSEGADDKFKLGGPESEKSSYQALVNYALDFARDADFISILEFDDEVTPNASNIITEHAEAYPESQILAPLVCVVKDINQDKPMLVGMANEAVFANGVAEERGFVDYNMMLKTNFLFVNGVYIKPEVFEEFGVFKENFEMFFDYEWALRVVYNGTIIRGIAKAGRFHYLYEDGMFEQHKNLDRKLREDYLGAARREYFFDEDRELTFE